MSGPGSLERLVDDDPEALSDDGERPYRRLASEDTSERIDAARALRVTVERDPGLVEPHLDALIALPSDPHGSLRLSGAVGLARLAEVAPARVERACPELTALLVDDAPAIQLATLRALMRVGTRFPAAVAIADGPVAALSSTAGPRIRTAVLSVFSAAVLADPSRFPETVVAYERALDDESARVRRCTASTIAAVASADPTVLGSIERLLGRVEVIEGRVNDDLRNHDAGVEGAACTLRSLVESDGT